MSGLLEPCHENWRHETHEGHHSTHRWAVRSADARLRRLQQRGANVHSGFCACPIIHARSITYSCSVTHA